MAGRRRGWSRRDAAVDGREEAHRGAVAARVRDLRAQHEQADRDDRPGHALHDAADEEHVGSSVIDAVLGECSGVGGLAVFVEVDAVVDDADAVGGYVIGAEDGYLGRERCG